MLCLFIWSPTCFPPPTEEEEDWIRPITSDSGSHEWEAEGLGNVGYLGQAALAHCLVVFVGDFDSHVSFVFVLVAEREGDWFCLII